MVKIITDKLIVDSVLTRGVETIYPKREKLEELLLSGKRIKLYCGFDPSAASMHIGNAILINKLAQFQALGHEVIFLVGDFTGMIGDPTDKKATRRKLTREEVIANSVFYQKQASAYLDFGGDNPAGIRYNSEWNDKMTFKELIELASNFTVQQMIIRDMFQKRLKEEKPIHLHEFLYPLAQGYDSVALDIDLEIGGNDQMFNMMCGRDLLRTLKNKEKFVLTMKLLADDQGKKMGKSEGNVVFLNESPANMYGQVMAWPDGLILNAFELCTKVPMNEIEAMRKDLTENNTNPRDYKMKLAHEITKIFHGQNKAEEAQDHFIKTIQKKETPDEVKSIKLKVKSYKITDLLIEIGLAISKSEAKRLIEQGGIKVNGEIIKDINKDIEITTEGVILQRGKFQFVKAIL